MTDKKIKHLSRAELIDITYEQQKRLEASEETIRQLQAKLEEKELHIAEAGSIAEAALKVNGIFEVAQAAAEQYLISLRAASANAEAVVSAAEKQRDDILLDARKQSSEILQQAEAKADKIVADAERQSQEKWACFEQRENEFIAAHEELRAVIGKGISI